ncbi:MAG: single-stranded DNA-binding protein [Patescibacteria group bacterium]
MNLNKVFIIGNLTRDPEMRTLPSGQPVCTFSIASNRTWKDKSGARQTMAEYHNIVMFGRLAEIAKQYLGRGKMVFIEGRIQTRSWEKDGQKKSRTEIVAEEMQMGPRDSDMGGGGGPQSEMSPQQKEEVETIQYPDEGEINPDEIPF